MAIKNNSFFGELHCICKLKHDIRVESKIDLAKREIEECLGFKVETIPSLPALIKKLPFSELDDEIIHRMTRLLYLGRAHGFLIKLFEIKDLIRLTMRATYLREIYGILKICKDQLSCLIEELGLSHVKLSEIYSLNKFIDINNNIQIFNQPAGNNNFLTTIFLIPHQTMLEFASEVLKLPYVTFTKQFTDLDKRLFVMEKGVKRGIDELIDYIKHDFHRMPWLGLFKEHIGDYIDWAFSDFRTWGLHFIHKHEGKADPWLARSSLNLLAVEEKSNVLDPFCGSGSFIADAPLMNINSYGIDINPLSTLIANVKCSLADLPLHELKETMINIHKKILNKESLTRLELKLFIEELKGVNKGKLIEKEKALERILLIKQQIDENVEEERIKNFLYVILSRSIVDLVEKKRANANIYNIFINDFIDFYLYTYASQEMIRQLNIEVKGKSKILTGDCRDVHLLLDGKTMNGIVCSPPYFDALDYVSSSRLPIILLGLAEKTKDLDIKTIGSKERIANLDSESMRILPESCISLIQGLINYGRIEKAKVILQYLLDMRDCLNKFSHIINKGARVIFVVGRYHHWKFGNYLMQVDGAQILIDLGESIGLVLEDELSHNISKIEAGKRIKDESIIIWKKDDIPSKRDPKRSKQVLKILSERSKFEKLNFWIRNTAF